LYQLQLDLFERRRAGAIGDTLLLLEHDPTITWGRGAKAEHLLVSEPQLAEQGVSMVRTDRGGDITLHAPGQLVAYPIIELAPNQRDVRKYVQVLAETMRQLVTPHGVGAGTLPDLIGLWADAEDPVRWPGADHCRRPVKLGAIGVRLSRWTTMHGFALNLTTDLKLFRLIVPCGIREHGVASVESLTGATPSLRASAAAAHRILSHELNRRVGAFDDLSAAPLDAEALAARLNSFSTLA
jgi:lipoyl(octanoyl) transferase